MIQSETRGFNTILRNLCFLFAAAHFWIAPSVANNESVRFAEKANLALRRTAHHLLIANGDTVSTIPPVKQLDANTFSIRMEHVLDYAKLPGLLQESLQMQDIISGYNVTVLDCDKGELQLGYNFLELNQKGGVACQDRAHEGQCYQLQVSFIPQKQEAKTGGQNWFMLSLGGALAGLGLIAWNKSRPKKIAEQVPDALISPKLEFSKSYLDIQNQTLVSGDFVQQLTFRETKLLSLFARHTNQILERDTILKSVWEDEGVTVGRSIDVFVSRLRKMLANDPYVKITAIHGVGYKMEVHS
ncbi:MAG: winged helix-turn-helix domain-containing protein [Dyadobacter sp.]|uniref:winged helix-turn-helix domain-containing protein n=1 Tax=Dyadobacter sp. TaxID=1914288 RepID=UPI003263FA40